MEAMYDLAGYRRADNLLNIKAVISIVWRSAEGMAYAHQQNVVHHDIIPANIMYDPDTDSVKITDFGIARITDSRKTKTGIILGTPSHMSPEQLAGKKVDGHSDLFSLDVMLFQLLTGSLPFSADSMAAPMFKFTDEDAPDIRTRREDLPYGIPLIIKKAPAKNVKERYQTGNEMATDLKPIFSELS